LGLELNSPPLQSFEALSLQRRESKSRMNKSRTTALLERVGLRERDPKELLREWSREIRREQRLLDRQLRELEREEARVAREAKVLARKGEAEAVRPLACALVQSKKGKARIHEAKAHMNQIHMQLRHQVMQLRMAKTMQKSTQLMTSMNKLMKVPELQRNLYNMQVEMERAGLIEEMMDDAIDTVLDTDGFESQVDDEVNKVIEELTQGILDATPAAPTAELAATGKKLYVESMESSQSDELDQRLAALQS